MRPHIHIDHRAVAVGAQAAGDGDDADSVLGDLSGGLAAFPFRKCAMGPGAYQLAPSVRSLGAGKYCFTIKVRERAEGCSGACCTTDLHKIEVSG
jgi:hypothetical protein